MLEFARCDPEVAPAAGLLAEMVAELNDVYETDNRLDVPRVAPTDLRPPDGLYLVASRGGDAVAGGGVRRWADGVGEIKRMYVRPSVRGQGVAAALLSALEDEAVSCGFASVRLDTGPRQVHAQRLYRRAGYVEIAAYNDNPFASYWAEKDLS